MTETTQEPQKRHRLRAADTTGQKLVAVSDISIDLTIGELVDRLLPAMQLQRRDSSGRPLEFEALLPREGRHLHRSETVAVLEEDDEIVLTPNVDAGRGRRG